jgi:hypothetical protein
MARKVMEAGSADSGNFRPNDHPARLGRTGLHNIVDNIVDHDIAGRSGGCREHQSASF